MFRSAMETSTFSKPGVNGRYVVVGHGSDVTVISANPHSSLLLLSRKKVNIYQELSQMYKTIYLIKKWVRNQKRQFIGKRKKVLISLKIDISTKSSVKYSFSPIK